MYITLSPYINQTIWNDMDDQAKRDWLDRIYTGWESSGTLEEIDQQLGAQGFAGSQNNSSYNFGPMAVTILDNIIQDIVSIVADRIESADKFTIGADQYVIRMDSSGVGYLLVGHREEDIFNISSVRMLSIQDADYATAEASFSDWIPASIQWKGVIKKKEV